MRRPWETPDLLRHIEAEYRAGISSVTMALNLQDRTGLDITPETLRGWCAKRWGARTVTKNHRTGQRASDMRTRRCGVCRKEKTMPQFCFRCAECRKLTAGLDADSGYRAAGLRVT